MVRASGNFLTLALIVIAFSCRPAKMKMDATRDEAGGSKVAQNLPTGNSDLAGKGSSTPIPQPDSNVPSPLLGVVSHSYEHYAVVPGSFSSPTIFTPSGPPVVENPLDFNDTTSCISGKGLRIEADSTNAVDPKFKFRIVSPIDQTVSVDITHLSDCTAKLEYRVHSKNGLVIYHEYFLSSKSNDLAKKYFNIPAGGFLTIRGRNVLDPKANAQCIDATLPSDDSSFYTQFDPKHNLLQDGKCNTTGS